MRIDKNTIFMTYPSTWWHDLWREGLVAGNGCIGANVYGGVKEEIILYPITNLNFVISHQL